MTRESTVGRPPRHPELSDILNQYQKAVLAVEILVAETAGSRKRPSSVRCPGCRGAGCVVCHRKGSVTPALKRCLVRMSTLGSGLTDEQRGKQTAGVRLFLGLASALTGETTT